MRTKTCDNEHPEITFSYISELEECPMCKIIEAHRWAIRDLTREIEEKLELSCKEIRDLEVKIEGLKLIIQIAHGHITEITGG